MASEGSDGDAQDPRITARLAEILAQAPILLDRLSATARAGTSPGERPETFLATGRVPMQSFAFGY